MNRRQSQSLCLFVVSTTATTTTKSESVFNWVTSVWQPACLFWVSHDEVISEGMGALLTLAFHNQQQICVKYVESPFSISVFFFMMDNLHLTCWMKSFCQWIINRNEFSFEFLFKLMACLKRRKSTSVWWLISFFCQWLIYIMLWFQ